MAVSEELSVQIPGYELLEKIGEGGMGAVYRARQLSLKRVVAVKILRAAGNAERAFQRETELLASLSHPNVVSIFDCSQNDGHSYLVTEFVPGTSLRSLMNPGEPWALSRAISLLDRVAGALAFIHGHGILHLDLKPENVLCTPEGEIKIADFGLAQPQAEARASAGHDPARGTLDYCSLEQRHGLPTDARSDLYSLAVLSYELLTGYVPGRAYESACRVNPKLPVEVDAVLRRGLTRRPEQRQESVEEFRRELMTALRGKNRRWRSAILASAILVPVAALLLGTTLFQREVVAENGPELAAPTTWLIADDGDGFASFGALTESPTENVAKVHIQTRYPEGKGAPPLPRWPSPRPAVFFLSSAGEGFFHPLFDVEAARELLAAWPELVKRSKLLPEDNWVRIGDFSGDRIWQEDGGAWGKPPGHGWQPGDGISVACPPDRPDDPALLLESSSGAANVLCYQWLGRTPEAPGEIMVLRYRARAENGDGRLAVGLTLPLHIPASEHTPPAELIRQRSRPHPHATPKPGFHVREYQVYDCVQPAADWRTYCVLCEWPPFCNDGGHRNVLVEYHGRGKCWLDDLEVFTWERGSKR